MRTHNKKTLMATAASVAIGMTLISNQAFAFDDVNWEWDKQVTENVVKDVTINIDNNPAGMVEIEKIQAHIGDVNATSTVTGVHNNAFSGTGGSGPVTVSIDDTFAIDSITDDSTDPNTIAPSGPTLGAGNQLQGELLGGTLDEGSDELKLTFRAFGDVTVDPEDLGALDAVDLPEVASTATAVGNNQSIDSTVSVDLHDGQFLAGGFTGGEGGSTEALEHMLSTPNTGNTHTDVMGGMMLSAALGGIEPAQISATSTVDDIVNASVDSSATAVGNNLSVNVAAVTPDDALVMADLTQFGYADITAVSNVSNVSVNGYTNFSGADMGPLADPQKPLVSSVATAVGNNATITVTSPSL